MENEIIKYLSQYVPIPEDIESAVIESLLIKSYKKGTILLKAGEISNECYFILKGCIRNYYLIDGEEKTTAFYTEGHPVSPTCYGLGTPSEQYLECVEDTIASMGTPDMEKEMFQKYPQVESICRIITESILAKNQESFADYMISTPEERYLNLLRNRPDLLQRVPQYQIASYLGIKPESLSRIRKRVMKKQK